MAETEVLDQIEVNPIALRKTKIVYKHNFGLSECSRVNSI